MFIGHFALGFAAKKTEPRLPLAWSFIACQWLDLVWPVLVLAGVEEVRVQPGATAQTPLDFVSYPWSHSLLMTLLYAAIGFFLVRSKLGRRGALLIAALVSSHWLLDFVTHRPDLPLGFGGAPRVGLGLWNNVPLAFAVEVALFAWGVWQYARVTHSTGKTGTWALWSLVAFFLLIHVANVFGPAPTAGTPAAAIAGPALAMWLFVGWAHWVDSHRSVA